MKKLITTLGGMRVEDIGMMLSHEHIFTDLRTEAAPGFGLADTGDVIAARRPELDRAKLAGIDVIVECTPVGVGRRADILLAISKAAGFPLVVPTGVYREPWLPGWVRESGIESLKAWMLGELQGNIGGTGVRAAWIKISAGDDGMTRQEAKVLEAAAMAGMATDAVIGSHTVKGATVRTQLDLIEKTGYRADRFIWIHAQAEPDFSAHVEMASRGAWISYDNIGSPESDEICLNGILKMVDLGFTDKLLISQDRGWYDPARPHGGAAEPFTYIIDAFLPKLRMAGLDDAVIRKLMRDNPFGAFARDTGA
jgi:phosphotriesterase-related protein